MISVFADVSERAINEYKNRGIDTVQVIEELLDLAKKISEADKRGDELGLSEAEIAFYDALADNESAVDLLGNETLKLMAADFFTIIRQNSGVDWTLRNLGKNEDQRKTAAQKVWLFPGKAVAWY